jgi:hypothetical protein
VGVSVPKQPTASGLRVLFFLCVSFCFTISIQLQGFFISHLMKPMYEKKLETLDELLHSDVVYGYHPALNLVQDIISYTEFVKFLEQKKLMEDYSDDRMCVE